MANIEISWGEIGIPASSVWYARLCQPPTT